MFLQSILHMITGDTAIDLLRLVIQKLNMLLCLVNDMLDIRMIENGVLEQKLNFFSPVKLLKFIISMFMPQCKLN